MENFRVVIGLNSMNGPVVVMRVDGMIFTMVEHKWRKNQKPPPILDSIIDLTRY